MKNQNGFTLIELVIVIVILTILSAVALPRFVDLGSDARSASINGLAGAVNSASDLVHARALTTGATSNVAIDGGTTVALTNGYPSASNTGIVAALKLSGNYNVTVGPGTVAWQHMSAPVPANCSVTYTIPGGSGSGLPPTITTITNAC